MAFGWWGMYIFFVMIVVFNMMLAIVLKSCVLRPASHNRAIPARAPPFYSTEALRYHRLPTRYMGAYNAHDNARTFWNQSKDEIAVFRAKVRFKNLALGPHRDVGDKTL